MRPYPQPVGSPSGTAGGVKEGPGTRLPEPARELWLRTREVIRSNLHGLQDPPVEYRLGGGTILAARWLHRESADIDVTVDDDTPLHRLGNPIQSAFVEQVKALGGEPRFLPELNKYKVLFDEGEIDIWARTPILREGHRRELVEGRQEVLLTNAQILRGKIERGDLNLSRDVYDVVRAAEVDPASLEAAINAIPHQAAESLAFNWHWSGPSLATDAARHLRGVPREELADVRTLGRRAATAARNALYDELRIRTADPPGRGRDDHGGWTAAPSGDGAGGPERRVRGARNQRTSEDEGAGSRCPARVCRATLPPAQRRLSRLSGDGRQGHALADGGESDEPARSVGGSLVLRHG